MGVMYLAKGGAWQPSSGGLQTRKGVRVQQVYTCDREGVEPGKVFSQPEAHFEERVTFRGGKQTNEGD